MSGGASEATLAADAQVILATQRWLERVVIGLNLCPFARAPFVQQRLRYRVSHALDEQILLADLSAELLALHSADPQQCETTLLIHPDVLGDFLDYNDFLAVANDALRELGLDGELQIASFHPDYQFADTAHDAIENHTNRSPHPTLHLLRESIADTDDIYRRNIATLRALGLAGWRKLMRDDI